jgi:hypothetical protein
MAIGERYGVGVYCKRPTICLQPLTPPSDDCGRRILTQISLTVMPVLLQPPVNGEIKYKTSELRRTLLSASLHREQSSSSLISGVMRTVLRSDQMFNLIL